MGLFVTDRHRMSQPLSQPRRGVCSLLTPEGRTGERKANKRDPKPGAGGRGAGWRIGGTGGYRARGVSSSSGHQRARIGARRVWPR